ncbi:MAG: putative surface protein with fasciclin (FAS1) repeats [bacterium]|jgi:uncharacterized surface protein with fasciclin (FAS1) repeats
MIKKYFALSVIAASVFVAGCSSDDNDAIVLPVVNEATPGTGGTAFDFIVRSEAHTTLETAIIAAGLADTLDDPTNSYTIFAPNDTAFTELDADGDDTTLTTAELVEPANRAALVRILQYHVLSGDVSSTDVTALIGAAAAAGDAPAVTATILVDDGVAQTVQLANSNTSSTSVAVNGVDIVTVDNVPSNVDATQGLVHVIASLLTPPPAPTTGGETGGTTGGETGGTTGGETGGTTGGETGGTTGSTGGEADGSVGAVLATSGTYEIFRDGINTDFNGSDTSAWTVFVPNDTILGNAGVTDLTLAQLQNHIFTNGAINPAALAVLTTIQVSSNASYDVVTNGGVTTVGGFAVELIGTGAGGEQVYSVAGVLAPTAP